MHRLPIVNKILPFIVAGIVIVVILSALLFFSSLLIIGFIIGLVLFMGAFIKEKLFKRPKKGIKPFEEKSGKTYEHKSDE